MGLIQNIVPRQISSLETENFVTQNFRVENFGFLVLSPQEKYEDSWYPTPNDIVPGGFFSLAFDNAASADLNNDGLDDLVIHPMLFPHYLPRETRVDPIILMQNSVGGFASPSVISETLSLPEKYATYRIGVGDFNGDGIQDLNFTTMPKPLAARTDDGYGENISESPLTIYGGANNSLAWTDTYGGLSLLPPLPDGSIGYNNGHSGAVGDFNGDGLSDWFSGNWVSYSTGREFESKKLVTTTQAALGLYEWQVEWSWPVINVATATDLNLDGYDDLVYSTMPAIDDGRLNGGDLYVMFGSAQGLRDGLEITEIHRSGDTSKNIGTNFMVSADFNGDGLDDVLFLEHGWTSESGDSTTYYVQGQFRLFTGDGKGGLQESVDGIVDPFAKHRSGEGNLFAVDVNGDGWTDLVSAGYSYVPEDSWFSQNRSDTTSVFLNDRGVLRYVADLQMAYTQPYQFAGEEHLKEWQTRDMGIMFPIDLGADGMMDFVGFVETPLSQWPQTEPTFTHAYISRAVTALGRNFQDEYLSGTPTANKIFAYHGNDRIYGLSGDDTIDGGSGTDIALYAGLRTEYTISVDDETIVQDRNNARDGTDTLTSVERLQFADINVALDTEGVAGQAYRIYKAAFDRAPDLAGLGYWIKAMDAGAALDSVAAGFVSSSEFQTTYGTNISNTDFITLLYANVLDRTPDDSGFDYWLTRMSEGMTREQVLANFSESVENKANVAELIADGIQYTAFIG